MAVQRDPSREGRCVSATAAEFCVRDYAPAQDDFFAEVVAGLRKRQKSIPCKFLYDEHGSELFERICELEEYYPTRTELSIMDECVEEMAAALGSGVLLVEYGSGSSRKTRLLLEALVEPVAYVPIDISREALEASARSLAKAYPKLEILPVCADYTQEFKVPDAARPASRTCVYFPGSTIGNFQPDPAVEFLRRMRTVAGVSGVALVGVDLRKAPEVLERAYDDREGVTAAFNLNLLRHINRELDADFPVEAFQHKAVYRPEPGRVEMHLVCERDLVVRIRDEEIPFREGESIHTENSYKYSLRGFAALAERAGFLVAQVWTDARSLFSVQLLVPRPT
jgi:dimethylhistidine N-methyltransferase